MDFVNKISLDTERASQHWVFLTNYLLVLLVIAREPGCRIRVDPPAALSPFLSNLRRSAATASAVPCRPHPPSSNPRELPKSAQAGRMRPDRAAIRRLTKEKLYRLS